MKKIFIIFWVAAGIIVPLRTFAQDAQTRVVSAIKLDDISLEDFAEMLRKEFSINVVLADKKEELSTLPRISIDFRHVPVWTVVRYACFLAGVKHQFRSKMLFIGKNLVLEKEYYPADYQGKSGILDKYPEGTRMFVGTICDLPIGYTQPQVTVSGSTVTVTQPMPIFKKFVSGTSFGFSEEPENKPAPEAKQESPPIPADYPITKAKLYDIKLTVDFQELPLREAFKRLREMSIQADPKRAGINFFIIPFDGCDEIIVDMTVNKMSLYRIISYICQSNGLSFRAAPYVVEIFKAGKSTKIQSGVR
ncbi:MAG: hypothetical protein WC071_04130 [Victivallaceae bacterium]